MFFILWFLGSRFLQNANTINFYTTQWKTYDLNVQYNEINDELKFIKDTPFNISTTNQIREIFFMHSQLNMLQDIYYNSDSYFVYNFGVIYKNVDK